jgi:hypothetical protein
MPNTVLASMPAEMPLLLHPHVRVCRMRRPLGTALRGCTKRWLSGASSRYAQQGNPCLGGNSCTQQQQRVVPATHALLVASSCM